MLVDGYISTAAALCAVRMNADVRSWLFYSHRGAEPGHRLLLQALDAEPLLALDLRLGEASGAALAVPLLQAIQVPVQPVTQLILPVIQPVTRVRLRERGKQRSRSWAMSIVETVLKEVSWGIRFRR